MEKTVLFLMILAGLGLAGLVDGWISETRAFGGSGHLDRSAIEQLYREAERIERVCRTPEGEALVRDNLKVRFSATNGSIAELREQGLGYGEIAILHSLSHASGTEAARLLRMRVEEKMGWGKIAAEVNPSMGQAVRSMQAMGIWEADTHKRQQMKRSEPEGGAGDSLRPERVGNRMKAERPMRPERRGKF